MIFLWVFIAVGAIFLVRWLLQSDRRQASGHRETALEILQKRYARGEINTAEFEEKKKELQ